MISFEATARDRRSDSRAQSHLNHGVRSASACSAPRYCAPTTSAQTVASAASASEMLSVAAAAPHHHPSAVLSWNGSVGEYLEYDARRGKESRELRGLTRERRTFAGGGLQRASIPRRRAPAPPRLRICVQRGGPGAQASPSVSRTGARGRACVEIKFRTLPPTRGCLHSRSARWRNLTHCDFHGSHRAVGDQVEQRRLQFEVDCFEV